MGSQQGHPTKGLPTLLPLFSLPGHADFLGTCPLEKEICLVLKRCKEWMDPEPPDFGDSRLPGSIIHVYDNNTGGRETGQRQEGTGRVGERVMAKKLWVLEDSRERGQRVEFQGTRGMDEVKRFQHKFPERVLYAQQQPGCWAQRIDRTQSLGSSWSNGTGNKSRDVVGPSLDLGLPSAACAEGLQMRGQ